MALLDAVGIMEAVISDLQIIGVFDRVQGHEPKSPPGKGVTASVWLDSIMPTPADSGLATVSIRLTFQVRLYVNMQRQPYDAIETDLLDAASQTMASYSGDFQLNGMIRNVDLLGEHGNALSAQAGYIEQDGKMFRVVTITLPLIINDQYTEVV